MSILDEDDTISDFVPEQRNVFQLPDPKELAQCTAQQLEHMLIKMAQLVTNAYDFEWYKIHVDIIWKHCKKKREKIPVIQAMRLPDNHR